MMSDLRKAAEQALEALENGDVPTPENVGKNLDAITALRERLAQPEQSVAGYCKKIEELIAERDSLRAALAQPEPKPVLQEIEQYRMQMAGISTAAIGYWKEGDDIHPDYDTIALRDVAKLYAKYDALYKAQPEQERKVWRWYQLSLHDIKSAIEAKLKEKNNV